MRLRDQLIALAEIFSSWQDLKIPYDMQAAYEVTSDRNDVVNLMSDSCLSRQSRSFGIEHANVILINPARRSSQFREAAASAVRNDLVSIRLSPLGVVLRECVFVLLTPLLPVLRPLVFIGIGPFLKVAWMACFPLTQIAEFFSSKWRGFGSGTVPAARFTTWVKVRDWLCRLASVAKPAWVGRFCEAFLASHRAGSAVCTAPSHSFLVRHLSLCSICLSMIRRTSSAIEIPSLLDSRLRNWRCGSVNEIICFVMTKDTTGYLVAA